MASNHPNDLETKTAQFCAAMQAYTNNPIYRLSERANSFFVVSLQLVSLLYLLDCYDKTPPISIFVALILSYVMTDFINGLVHMFLDNNSQYSSWIGPMIAASQLHHIKLLYPSRRFLQSYFFESGTKYWLLGYLIVLVVLQHQFVIPFALQIGLVSFGIFSSVAELSHYWCHNASGQNKIIRKLQNSGLLLSKKHHRLHHSQDNQNYAFLNGISDPLINRIAGWFYKGYKNHADLHAKAYLDSQRTTAPLETTESFLTSE